jgi:hypothetical protein
MVFFFAGSSTERVAVRGVVVVVERAAVIIVRN